MTNQDQNNYNLDIEQAALAWKAMLMANKIAIISHRSPDADTIGANLSLNILLTSLGKEVTSVSRDPLGNSLNFLPGIEKMRSDFDPDFFDLVISVDCGSMSQTAYDQIYPNMFGEKFINIDHHASNNNFGAINIVNPKMSSTCEIIYNLFKLWNIPLNATISTYMLAGLYYDTGSFMHPNTTPSVLQMAEDLLKHGAAQQKIIRHLYKNFSLGKFHLWGETLANLKVTSKNSVVAVVTPELINHNQANHDDLGGVITYLSMVKDNDYAVLINQDETGQIKGSLRTSKNQINVSEMAEQLGGGGHKKASGFGFPGKMTKETFWKIVN